MSFTTLPASAVDAKSPISEYLMELIKDNLDDHESRIQANSSFDFQFKANGYLDGLGGARRNRVDGGLISKSSTLTACRILLEDGGIGGDLEIDVRRYTKPNCEITGVDALFADAIQSIARAGSSINTQSITRATPQISTQSIARYKSTLSITSIVDMGYDAETGNKIWKINLNGAPDADYEGRTATIASASSGGNNGNFTIVRVKDDGGNNVVVENASGVAQDAAAGTLDLDLWKYTYTNPVNAYFVAGENAYFSSHSNAANDGHLPIFAINQSGNNIIVINVSGVAQGSAAGAADCNEFYYATSASVSSTDYVAGEYALMASHTSSNSDGTLLIKEVNPSAGNGLIAYKSGGATQGGAAGTINTNRWVYSFSADPSSDVDAGHSIIFSGCTSSANDGTFTVKETNRSAGTNIVVHNTSGVAQGGAVGDAITSRKKVKFGSDQSSYITTDSRILVVNCPTIDKDDYDVLEVNRGGGANYNAVISTTGTSEQAGASGRIPLESKSVFDTRPKLTVNDIAYNWQSTHGGISSNMVLDSTQKIIPEDTLLFMDIISAPTKAKNLVVQLL